mmetsp:Transcript_30578/g.27079  ORF Transcript_30578/g.27079 Transcript_30578/m.27079 type:complete len:122 (-) Transcript_30578:83-448(-)
MQFVYEKSRKGWIPKNMYRQFPHIREGQIFSKMEAMERINDEQNNIENPNINQENSQKYDANDTQELFRRDFRNTIGSLANVDSGIDFSVRDIVDSIEYSHNMSIGEAVSLSRKDSVINSQ